ncbi:hypothetical protein CMI42_03980, partial [Candidatus Pacearchaeota archaeon]|nr:hypothetical protein [Candidatus Pacearchaeota archaeon]
MEEEIKKEDYSQEKVDITPKIEPEVIPETKTEETPPQEKKEQEMKKPLHFSSENESNVRFHETSEDDDDISIDLSKVKDKFSNFFKSDENEETDSTVTHLKNKDDDDISIDLSKVKDKFKNFLKSDKPEESHKEQTPSENKDDDEISVDFSKVKQKLGNIFKSEEEKVDIFSEEKDDNISFDFSKIKNIFKKDKTKKEDKDDDDISFDFKKVTDFTKKNSKWIIPLILIIIAISFSTHFRMMSANLPITDDWAQSQVNTFYRNQISQQINQQYPNLPQQNRDSLVEKEFQTFYKENKDLFNQQVAATSQQYKAQLQDENGQTYLLAIDPYLWFGEARNYINNGHFGTEKVDGKDINFLRNGRVGKPGEPGSAFHLYFEVFLYKFFHFFNKNVSLMGIVFLVPVIIIGLSVIPAFLIGRKISGNVGGFFASFIVATNAALLSRTPAGFSDTDAYNILFPLLILWLFLEALDAKETKNKLIYSGIAGLSVGLYSAAWGGWWYAFGFALATLALYLVYIIITEFKKIKNILSLPQFKNIFLVGITFFLSSAVFVTIFM